MTPFNRSSAPLALTLLLAASPLLAQTTSPSQAGGAQAQTGTSEQAATAQKPGSQAKLELPQVSGRIMGIKEVKSKAGQTYRMVRLETRGGRTLVADLGPVDGLRNVNLKAGQQVVLTGHPGRIGNRIVFFANELRAADRQPRSSALPRT